MSAFPQKWLAPLSYSSFCSTWGSIVMLKLASLCNQHNYAHVHVHVGGMLSYFCGVVVIHKFHEANFMRTVRNTGLMHALLVLYIYMYMHIHEYVHQCVHMYSTFSSKYSSTYRNLRIITRSTNCSGCSKPNTHVSTFTILVRSNCLTSGKCN